MQVSQNDKKLPLVVLDTMLPRQVLNITVQNGLLMELIRERLQEESPRLGMVGNAKLSDGTATTLMSGVEVEIIGKPKVTDGKLQVSLKGTRRFRVDERTVESVGSGWTQASVKFLNSTLDDLHCSSDPMSINRATEMARELGTDPERQSLVELWLELARKRERLPGQIDGILRDLGPMPDGPTECALWVGALINPIPAMGVALEIRPKLLLATTAEERTQIALDGIQSSIQHMQAAKQSI